jgi:antirestriction protein ArdC
MTVTATRKRAKSSKAKGPTPEEKIVNEVIESLEKGVNPWRCKWQTDRGLGVQNFATDQFYSGGNVILLSFLANIRGYKTDSFAGFKQAQELSLKMVKGSKACYIIRPQINKLKKDVYDPLENVTIQKEETWTSFKTVPVFNLDCFEDSPEKEKVQEKLLSKKVEPGQNNKIATVEKGIKSYIKRENIKVTFEGDRCFYSPSEHLINMVELSRFSDSEEYYATYLHEAIHSTKKTLKRDLESRGLEELVAEMGALLLCKEHFKISCDYLNHVSYLNSWIKNLKENPKVLFKMLSHASKASKFFIEGEPKK